MEATELIELIRTSEKKTPVRVVLQANAPCEFPGAEVFSGGNGLHILYGDWKTLGPQLTAQAAHIDRLHVENGACNSAIPMLDLKGLHARVEPGDASRKAPQHRRLLFSLLVQFVLVLGDIKNELDSGFPPVPQHLPIFQEIRFPQLFVIMLPLIKS